MEMSEVDFGTLVLSCAKGGRYKRADVSLDAWLDRQIVGERSKCFAGRAGELQFLIRHMRGEYLTECTGGG